MAGRTTEQHAEKKARRTVKVRQSGASWRGANGRAGWETIDGHTGNRYSYWASCALLAAHDLFHRNNRSCGLLGANGARHARRPFGAFRPAIGEPEHGLLERACRQITTIGNVVELRSSIKNDRRNALSSYAERVGVGVCNNNDLVPELHAAENAVIRPHLSRGHTSAFHRQICGQ